MGFFLYSKNGQLILAVLAFLAVLAILLLIATVVDRVRGRKQTYLMAAIFGGPALLLLVVGLIYPAIRTMWMSLMDKRSDEFVGLDNYAYLFNDGLQALGNSLLWVVLVPLGSTVIGLVYSVLIDKSRFEKVAKSLLFLPMAISFVGAGIIWKFVYEYRGAAQEQIGLLNAVITQFGAEPVRFLQDSPWNTVFLIVVMVWIQAGFAMVVLSAAIKAVPTDIVEAAKLDGAGAWQLFFRITIPSIRPSLVVVLTTICIATLKVFDITQTMTGAEFKTQVLANEMYDWSFTYGDNGIGSAMAVVIFLLVVPVVIYNVRQMNKNKAVRG
ncbi:alpha-glucoside transport system permease protein AglF [Microbacterium nanhaiense]|uniref:Alpha-glucoside transport system permease protein AglF n=1 Tax=Microbacterium nanhaiense TaxID=1301026 RepID=A0ABQ2N5D7_9MICO|nr:sugar ABC transporter permease [Microbacterium nanhaiense]GGO66889.1 alpha-glucoside transport system permease protein AglF [Microbacterium nanhaiense]